VYFRQTARESNMDPAAGQSSGLGAMQSDCEARRFMLECVLRERRSCGGRGGNAL